MIAIDELRIAADDERAAVIERQMRGHLHRARIGEIGVGEGEGVGRAGFFRQVHGENIDALEAIDLQSNRRALLPRHVGRQLPGFLVSTDVQDVPKLERARQLADAAGGLLGLVAQLALPLLKQRLVLGEGALKCEKQREGEADAAKMHWASEQHHISSDGGNPWQIRPRPRQESAPSWPCLNRPPEAQA